MNQRIFELVEKAELYQPGELMTNWDEEDYVVSPEELKKFAQLIIQECASVCLEQRDPMNLNYKPSEKFADAIKFHFGLPRN